MAIAKKVKKVVKPFFLEDSAGKLYKATSISDEDFELEEDSEEEVLKEDAEGEAELISVTLSAEDFEILKQLIAEKKEMHDADEEEPEEKTEDSEIEEEEKEEVVDTCSAKDSLAGFGSLESTSKTSVIYDDVQNEIADAWSKRYNGK